MINDHEEEKLIRDQYKVYLDALKNNDPDICPPPELLQGFHQKELQGKMKRTMEEHIVQCPLCLKALEALSNTAEVQLPANWSALEKKMDESFYADLKNMPPVQKQKENLSLSPAFWESFKEQLGNVVDFLFQPKRLAYAGVIAGFAVVCLYSYAYLSRDTYFSLARIQPEQPIQLRSQNSTSEFMAGLQRYEQKEYSEAIVHFDSYLKSNPDHYASLYYIGLSHLAQAEEHLLGLGYTFDASKVENGITSLSRALQLSGDNLYYRADCYWYLGKSYLMMGNIAQAKVQFLALAQLDKPYLVRKTEAMEILRKLH